MNAYPGDLLLHLTSFVALARHVRRDARGAFEGAARDLHVDRSVLRRRMQTLSGWIGAPLLGGRGAQLRLTAAGGDLFERADRILIAIRDLATEVRVGRESIVLGCTGTITTEVLPHVLVELERLPRGPRLIVRRAGGATCERLVRAGELDIGVVRAGGPIAGLSCAHLAGDRLYVALPAPHPLAVRRRPRLGDLAAVPLVLYGESSKTRARVMEKLEPLGARIRVEVEGKSAALDYVRLGFGATFLSVLPGHAVQARGVVMRDVTSLFERSAFYVIARRERAADPSVSDVIARVVHRARAKR